MSTNTKKDSNSIFSFIKLSNLPQIIVVLAAIVGAYFIGSLSAEVRMLKEGTQPSDVLAEKAPVNQPQEAAPADLDDPTEDDFIRGNANSKIALIEYSDYDCPFCSTFHETAIQAVEELDIMWVYRHLPLEQLHPDAYDKAVASECAAIQGGDDAFWQFSDIVFAEGTEVDQLSTVITRIGLNANDFNDCIANNQAAKDAVDADMDSAARAQVNGTPGNFLLNLENGSVMPLRGAVPFDTLSNAVSAIQ